MNHTKGKCPICGEQIQEGRKDYFCHSFALGQGCNFCISKQHSIVSILSEKTLERSAFLKLIQPAGLTIPIQNKVYQFQIITKGRKWHIGIRESIASEINHYQEEWFYEDNKNPEPKENGV